MRRTGTTLALGLVLAASLPIGAVASEDVVTVSTICTVHRPGASTDISIPSENETRAVWKPARTDGSIEITGATVGELDEDPDGPIVIAFSTTERVMHFDQTLTFIVDGETRTVHAPAMVDCTPMPESFPSLSGRTRLDSVSTHCDPPNPEAGVPNDRAVALWSVYIEDYDPLEVTHTRPGASTIGFFNVRIILDEQPGPSRHYTFENTITATYQSRTDDTILTETYPATVSMICPMQSDPPPDFIDLSGSVFTADIEWLAAAGITRGCNPPTNNRFCPDDPVTRGQMAAFLRRALDLPAAPSAGFTDTTDSTFTTDIDRLAAAGITRGCNPPTNNRFCPDDPVTRGQMAAFLRRALG